MTGAGRCLILSPASDGFAQAIDYGGTLMRPLAAGALACVAILTLLFTVQNAQAGSVESVAQLRGPERQSALEAGARHEGVVVWSGSVGDDMRAALSKAFTAKYPFLRVEGQRLGVTQSLQRAIAERSGKTPARTDLLAGNVLVPLRKAELAQAFRSPLVDALPKEFQEPNGLSAPYRFAYYGIAYNTALVNAADAPRNYEDLLDPKWRGKIVWNNGLESGAPVLITYFRRLWGEDRAGRFLQRLAQQIVRTELGTPRETLDGVVNGKSYVMLGASLHQVAALRAAGASVDATMQDPVLARDNHLVLLKSAPHPHAAMLFVDFLLDREAQEILRGDQYYPANPDVDPPEVMMPYDPLRRGLKQFTADDSLLAQERDRSISLLREYFR